MNTARIIITWTVTFTEERHDNRRTIHCHIHDAEGNQLGGSTLTGASVALDTYPELVDVYTSRLLELATQDIRTLQRLRLAA